MAQDAAPRLDGELRLRGRIATASNQTFLGEIDGTRVVYKPRIGEKPLWDFPDGDLADREVAAYLVSEALGWSIVPLTWLRDGPLGPGMVQVWREPDPAHDPVDVVRVDEVPGAGWRRVLDGLDDADLPVALIHEDSLALRRMAVFDVLVNNADRKGGHVLPMPDGHRYGVDHGLTFHEEHKLRTVLWGWQGDALTPDECAGIDRVLGGLAAGARGAGGSLGTALAELISPAELDAFADRCRRTLRRGCFPAPSGPMPATPWPLF